MIRTEPAPGLRQDGTARGQEPKDPLAGAGERRYSTSQKLCPGAETAVVPETAAAPETETLPGMLTGPLTEKHFPWYFGSKDDARTDEE